MTTETFPQTVRASCDESKAERRTIVVSQATGTLWFAGWLFTIGFAHLAFWKGLLGLILWPYFLGTIVR